MAVQDPIGERGQILVAMLLTRFFGRSRPFFRAQFLGDKHPAIDFLVELLGVTTPLVPYFFVQAKATRLGYTTAGQLRVRVPVEDMSRLVSYPAPTYIIGVDEPQERGYLLAATVGGHQRLTSLPTRYPLDAAMLQMLYDEVLLYWPQHQAPFRTSRFV